MLQLQRAVRCFQLAQRAQPAEGEFNKHAYLIQFHRQNGRYNFFLLLALATEQPQRPPQHLASRDFFHRHAKPSTVSSTIAGAA